MRGYGRNELMPRSDFKCKCRMLESTAKKIKIVKPGDNAMVPVPYSDKAKIGAHSRHANTYLIFVTNATNIFV